MSRDHTAGLIGTMIALSFAAITLVTIHFGTEAKLWFDRAILLPIPEISSPKLALAAVPADPQKIEIFDVHSKSFRTTTAYVAGDRACTDADPCISSDGSNICRDIRGGEKICAANFVPLGTQLYVEGFGICTVKDRLHPKYKQRVDIAMRDGRKKQAKTWGKQNSEIKVLR